MTRRRITLIEMTLLFGAALAIRLLHGLAIRGEPMFGFPLVDETLYWKDALAIASGAPTDPVFYRPPLLAYLLAGIVRVVGESASAARFVLLGLSALAAPLTALVARPVAGRAASLLSAAFVALYAPAIFYGGELLPASTVLLLNLGLLLALFAAERSGREAPLALSGILLGLSALAWPTILAFLPPALFHFRRARRGMLLLLAGTAVGLAPAFLYNLRGGDLVPVSSNGGVNFYMGNHEGADGRSAVAPELPNDPMTARRVAGEIASGAEGRALRPSEVSAFWLRRGISWIAGNPGDAAALLVQKIYLLVNDRDISDNIDLGATEERSLPLRAAPFRYGLLLALAVPGIPLLRRTRNGRLLLLYGASLALSVLAFFVVGRFRIPLLPLLAIAAAAGLVSLAKGVRKNQARALPAALLVVAVLFFSRTSLYGVGEDMTWHYEYLRGDALYRMGDLEGATASFEESIRREGRMPLVKNALGYLYAERGVHLDRAEALIREAIAEEPDRRRFYLDSLGRVFFRQGRLEEAAAAFEEALALLAPDEAPSRAETLGHLAEVREAEGRGEEAASLRAEAVRIRPR